MEFLLTAGKLKKTKRTGWVLSKVPHAESVAEHSYRMALMAYVLAAAGVDRDRLIRMALVHDIGEAITGDIAAIDPAHKNKDVAERKAVEKISRLIENDEVKKLCDEYFDLKTKEAQLLREIDKMEMIVQAFEYEEAHPEVNLQSFWDDVGGMVSRGEIKNKTLVDLFKSLEKRRRR